ITIQANEWCPEIQRLIDFINQQKPDRLFGVDGEQTVLLDPNEIDFFYVENRKTYEQMKQRRLVVRMKIFEVDESLASRGVIGNINRIERFELSLTEIYACTFNPETKNIFLENMYLL